MFIITNREVNERGRGFGKFGDRPNSLGSDELRIVEANRVGSRWRIKVLPDEPDDRMLGSADLTGINASDGVYHASHYVAAKLRASVPKDRRHVLLYVHGFNNDMEDVLSQADALGRLYRMEVIAFSWPARGGGKISGTLSYKRDKRTARQSVGALDRTIGKVHDFLTLFNQQMMEQVIANAASTHPDNPLKRDEMIARESEQQCPFCVSALFHSMGNYLFKHALLSSIFESRQTVFDNVILAAADTNNDDHARWVDEINCRHRVYVTINEDDYALSASRLKMGDAQRARLGHYLRGLNATRALYVDFTNGDKVGRSHSYFVGGPTANAKVKRFFRKAFQGKTAEEDLRYHVADNVYRP